MLASRGPHAVPQSLPHNYATDAPVQKQGVPAAGSATSSIMDPPLRAAEPWTHFRGPVVQDPIGQTSESTSRKRKAGDEDSGEDDSASISAQHEQERTTRIPARLKGKGKARHTDPDAAEGAGPSTPPLTLLPAHSNQKRGKKEDDAKDYATKSRAYNGASRLILNDLMCTDHKVHYKLGGSKKPEKEVLENDVKHERDQLAIFLSGRTQYALELDEANRRLLQEKKQLEDTHHSLFATFKAELKEKDDECIQLRVNERKWKQDVVALNQEIATLKEDVVSRSDDILPIA
ncbi:hypothetical protein EWM64_g1595 [Hericium alpestre]|uniref:Uncharacterized protein n=1 Tax=Hericium alpestre TaxID=135208 RepID=A0A4Z0AA53_9AGAM|nr:hypothetical protein EWM64_g1595 [Hericium alpestre]